MKRITTIILVVLLFEFILSSCDKTNGNAQDTTFNETSSLISTLNTAEAKRNYFFSACEKTMSLEQVDFKKNVEIKQITDILAISNTIKTSQIYKKLDDSFTSCGSIITTSNDSIKNQQFYYSDNATYINDDTDKEKYAYDILELNNWGNTVITSLNTEDIKEISCIMVENGMKITIIGDISSIKNETKNGIIEQYLDEYSDIKSYRLIVIVNNDGYIIEANEYLTAISTHEIVGLGTIIINNTITTNLTINNPGSDVNIVPFTDTENYETVTK